MGDFFDDVEYENNSRFEHRSTKRSKRRRVWVVISLVILLVVAAGVGGAVAFKVLGNPGAKRAAVITTTTKVTSTTEPAQAVHDEKAAASSDESTTAQTKQVSNVLMIGVQEIANRKVAKGILLAKIDLANNIIQAVNIPERTYLNITGLGADQISESFNMGLASTKKAVQDLLHIETDSHIVMHYEDFETLVSDNRFQVAFEKAIETSLFEGDKQAYGAAISKIDASKINIVPLPVKYISINGEPFYEPNNEEISKLVESLWGIKIEVKTQPVRIIVLNGSGKPGAGKQISDKLVPSGYMIIDVKNASSFDYKTTQIVAYKEDVMDKAKIVQQLLGVGDVVYHPVSQDVAEIAIIAGQDLKPAK
ncbi:MAG TPA: LytR C-terminal domain-containing protein [Candidatus Aquicultor sp.]|jgi:hypothetical protein